MALYSSKRVIGKKLVLSPSICRWVYTAVVRPIILYGVIVWWPALVKASNRNLLSKVQRMSIISISRAIRTTPNYALNVFLYILLLDLLGQQMAFLAELWLRETEQWESGFQGHACILEKYRFLTGYTDRCVETPVSGRNFVMKISSSARLSLTIYSPHGTISKSFYLSIHISIYLHKGKNLSDSSY